MVRREIPTSKVVPEYAPVCKIKQNRKQPTKPHNPSSPHLPTPPHTAQRELELQCRKESLGTGLGSEESIEERRATRPQNQALQQLVQGGSCILVRSSCPRRAGMEAGIRLPLLGGQSFPAPWCLPSGLPGCTIKARSLGGPTAGSPGNKTGSVCWLGGVRNIMQKQVGFLGRNLDPLPPGGA